LGAIIGDAAIFGISISAAASGRSDRGPRAAIAESGTHWLGISLSLAASHIFKWEPVFIFQAALTRHSASFLCPELHTAAILIDELDAGGLKGAPKGSLRDLAAVLNIHQGAAA